MKKHLFFPLIILMVLTGASFASDTVPPVIDLPGSQPGEIGTLESPDKCDNCHGGYNASVEPAHNWRGSMMGNAGRDPIFWATLAIAEQDFDGAGDLCIRCHSTGVSRRLKRGAVFRISFWLPSAPEVVLTEQ